MRSVLGADMPLLMALNPSTKTVSVEQLSTISARCESGTRSLAISLR